MIRPLRRASKGQALVILAVCMVVLLALAALALDVGMAYGVKAKLNAATDAAAIAALIERTSGSGSKPSSETVGANYLYANFPYQSIGVARPGCTVEVTSSDEAYTASVTATTVVPTYLAKVIGWTGLTVTTNSEATRSSLDMALVLDSTTSLAGVFGTVKDAAVSFVDRFSDSFDRVALIPFASGVALREAGGKLALVDGEELRKGSRGFSKVDVKSKIRSLNTNFNTASEMGIRVAMMQLDNVPNPARRRAIVFFSDGAPNTFTGNIPIDDHGDVISGNLYSGPYPGEVPTIYQPDQRRDVKQNAEVYQVPRKCGGNRIGSVTLTPEVDTDRPRPLGGYNKTQLQKMRCDANKAARNALENIAEKARSEGIVIFSLGYGPKLDEPEAVILDCSTDNEKGTTIMKRVANTPDSDTYNPSEPSGIFCYAKTREELPPCFNAIANSLLRLTK